MRKSTITLCAALILIAEAGHAKFLVIPIKKSVVEASIYWTGEWAENRSYKGGDGIQYKGSSYLCLYEHTSSLSTAPPNTAYWDLMAAKGEQGTDGVAGPTGPAGPQGPKGDAGPQGVQGLAGADGVPGPQGIQGPQGSKGDIGDAGPQGPIGVQGLAGADGAPEGLKEMPGRRERKAFKGQQGRKGLRETLVTLALKGR